jgi:hypothetical protein
MAVPMARRDFEAGPLLSLRARIVACGDFRFPAPSVLQQHAAKRLVGENAGEVVHAAVAFGLADHSNDLIGGELALADAGLQPGGILHALQLDFSDLNGHSTFSLNCSVCRQAERVHGTTSPRSIFS